MTPSEIRDELRNHESRLTTVEDWRTNTVDPTNKQQNQKIDKMDRWLSDVAEPTLNRPTSAR
jgi:hypothetical protein